MDGPGDLDRVRQVARLYLVVHGRPPDAGGLQAFVQHLRDGRSLVELAAEFLDSQEFHDRVRPEVAVETLCRAGGLTDVECAALAASRATLPALVLELVSGATAQRRLPLLPALFPEGVPLDNAAAYRLWLAERPAPAPQVSGNGIPAITFVMLLRRPNQPLLLQAIVAALAQPPGLSELVVVAPGWIPWQVRRLTEPGRVAMVMAAPWASKAALFRLALRRARGRLVSIIGQHDLLDPAAATTLSSSDADVVLADDDLLDAAGQRHSPRLGAAWDRDTVMATGVPGLVAIGTDLVRRVGGMRRLGGFSERDLVLRAVKARRAARVTHVPAVLLSRRDAAEGGTVQQAAMMETDGCTIAAVDGAVIRLVRTVPDPPPLVSVIIPTRDRVGLLRTCADALLRRTSYPALEVVIVDNGSVEPEATALLAALAEDPRVRVVSAPGPFNWSALNNSGVAAASGTVIVLLNNDIDVIDPAWLHELVAQAMRPEVGAVGAKLLYPDGRVQHAGVALGPAARGTHVWRFSPGDAPGYLDQLRVVREVSAVTGACLATRRDVYLAVGGCEAEALPITWNDVDLCLRVREAGLRVIWTPNARLLHLEQASRGSDDSPERQARYQQARDWMRARWGAALDDDAFMSPQLLRNEGPGDVAPRLSNQH